LSDETDGTQTYSKAEVDGIVRRTHDNLVSKLKQSLILSIIEQDTRFRSVVDGMERGDTPQEITKTVSREVYHTASVDIVELIAKAEIKIALSQEEADFYKSAGAQEA
tara:strand:- start:2181 stop:2504 length:324 start_codon:yes stop_codon:yes gene_type:complete